MDWIQALILGIVQGLTEYLPVSSSGHLEIGKVLLGPEAETGGLIFDLIVHVATVLSTLVILWKEIAWLLKGIVKFQWNDEMRYAVNILISMIPVGIVGVFFKDEVEALFMNNVLIVVGCCLLVTAILLAMTHFYRPQERMRISPLHAFIIGLAQAVAVLPGLSRSGSTIATGLLLGNSKEKLAQFSFIMVIPPILGAALLDLKDLVVPSSELVMQASVSPSIPVSSMIVGFLAAFFSGCLACKWMIAFVKKCKLIYFAIYCAIVGVIALYFGV
jgi:undecaprenyl-diphosphatase